MKKNLIVTFSMLLSSLLIFSGCKKNATETIITNETPALSASVQIGNNSSCKLTHNAWANVFTWDFHYNDKELADEWKIAYPNGYVQNFKMKYDKFNKLIEAPAYDDFNNLIFTNYFTYSGNRVISQKWADLLGGGNGETLFSYNSKGQIVREDDGDTHDFQTYDNMGNCIRSDYYIGTDLYFSDNYEFNSPVRDPLLTVSGVDFMFPYSGVGYFNKLWFSRNLSIVYDSDGNPFVINDLGASKTDFRTGPQHFPISVNYYDKTSESPFDFTFGYSCNANRNFSNQDSSQSNSTTGTNKAIKHSGPMLHIGSGKSIKEQLQELRKQYSK